MAILEKEKTMKNLILALRPKQWIKNLFIFLPLIFGNKLFVFPSLLKTAAAFFLFSLTAGIVYLINDVIDLEQDRLHPVKSQRPIASGKVGIKEALIASLILGILSITLSFMLNSYFGWIVVTYLLLNFIYSKILKRAVIIDVFCLGAFFLLRIMAGSAIAEVELSHWIIIMAALLALFLGFNKRRQELKLFEEKTMPYRYAITKYNAYFIDQMISIITSSIVIVYMLYTVDTRTVKVFGSKHLMSTIPFVYYGIFRYLYLIHKIKNDGDPVRILYSDTKMQLNLVLWIVVCILIIYFRV